ncbi:MAG: PqiC family protein [Polyangia bacterium]
MGRTRRSPLLLLTLLSACSFLKPHADPTKYYVLTTAPPKEPAAATPLSVGVDRITLPAYLQRPELVARRGSNELQVSEYDRWGEPLKDSFTRALRQDLALRLGKDQVTQSPWEAARAPDVVVDVDVRRFERVDDVAAELQADWSLRSGKDGTVALNKEATLRQPLRGSDAQATATALSEAVAALSAEIAAAARAYRH